MLKHLHIKLNNQGLVDLEPGPLLIPEHLNLQSCATPQPFTPDDKDS